MVVDRHARAPAPRPRVARFLAAAAFLVIAGALAPGAARAQVPPADAGAPSLGEQRTLRTLPAGQPVPPDGVRPASMPGRLVAVRAPIAVHGAPGTPAEVLRAVRDAAVRALDALEWRYGFPLPAPDGVRGGGPELDVYVVPRGPAVDVTADGLEQAALWDRSPAFVAVRGDLAPDDLARAVAEGVAQAVLLGIDARAAPAWRVALAAALAERTTGLGPDLGAVAGFQRDPGAALLANRDAASARGAALFVNHLALAHDREDLALLRGLAWMPVARTPPSAPRLADEPDVFDVMARLFRDEPGGLEGVLGEFAVARALVGSAHDPLVGFADDPALRPDRLRTLSYAALPAWVTPPRMLDKTGSAYVAVDTRRAGAGALNLWFHGVPWRRWIVDALRLDSGGRVVGRVPHTAVVRGEWSAALAALDGVAQVLVVITDLGNGDLDPDVPPDRNGFFALNVAP